MTIPVEIREAILTERHRCIGLILRGVGLARLSGDQATAHLLDDLAEAVEHPHDDSENWSIRRKRIKEARFEPE